MSTERQCKFHEVIPVYAKRIGGITIDPSEYTHRDGAHIMDRDIACRLVADAGEKYCPRHKWLKEQEGNGDT